MPVSIVVGGQYGSEGKGKVSHFFAKKYNATAVIRAGGPNSGHTVMDENDNAVVFKHLPTACIIKGVKSILTAGHYINPDILMQEIEMAKIPSSDLLIDPFATIITEADISNEKLSGLSSNIGSTICGLGASIINRTSRTSEVLFAKDISQLKKYIVPTNEYLRNVLDNQERIIIEGTQGFGLSLLHSDVHPYCTSRDTTAACFLSESGLSPMDVDEVIMVIRAYPIRVAGNSGPLRYETTWEQISDEAGSDKLYREFTSVSKKLRRVAAFDSEIVKRAIAYNNPTLIVLNHLDYLDAQSKQQEISFKMKNFLSKIEKALGKKIDYVGCNRQTIFPIVKKSILEVTQN